MREGAFKIYSLIDTVRIDCGGGAFNPDEGTSKTVNMSVGRYLAKIYKEDIEYLSVLRDDPQGVSVFEANFSESDVYEPRWIEFEITEDDVAKGTKSLGTVNLEKKKKYSVPKPTEVKSSKK